LALKWHPDRNQQSEEQKQKADKMFKDVNEAYKVLTDSNERKRYDMGGYDPDLGGGFGGGTFTSNIDPNEIFNMFFSSAGGGASFMSGGASRPGGRMGGMSGMNMF